MFDRTHTGLVAARRAGPGGAGAPLAALRAARRAILVVLLVALLLAFAVGGSALAFTDVPSSHQFAEAIDGLAAGGMVAGYSDDTFRPDQPVTRQQFAKLIVLTLGLPTTTADLCRFPDVASTAGDGLYPDHFVAVAAANGITRGHADGTFAPRASIERRHAVTMVMRALERIYPAALVEPPAGMRLGGDWDALSKEQRGHAVLALFNGLLAGLDLQGAARDPRAPMPRGEVAQVLYNMMRLLPAVPAFESSVHQLDDSLRASMKASGSWKDDTPIPLNELRLLRVSYWGFDGRPQTGDLVVDGAWADDLRTVFRKLYEARFPIWSMNLIDEYGASDDLSMAADNTSAFNTRHLRGTSTWSMHSYGRAVDINPIENPYIRGGSVVPAAGKPYVDRSLNAPGMVHSWDVVVRAFESIGWKWGGDWTSSKDYQHFSSNGR